MSALTVPLIAGGLTLVLSLALPVAVRPLLMRLGIMDVPNERSSHERPVLRGLGLAVLIAMAAGFLCALLPPGGGASPALWIVAGASVLSGLLGLSEDLKGVSVPVRSVLLLGIALAGSALLVWLPPAGGAGAGGARAWVGGLPFIVQALLVVYGVLFVSSYINVANFMDGLNGISGFHGAIAGATFAAAGALAGLPWLVAAGLVLAAGFAGFLPWNLTRPGAFLGDVGSYLLGGATAITSFAALMAGVPILATIGPMIIYFGDVGVTLAKRVRAGKKWDEPHKEHVYQRLQQAGLSHGAASGVAAAFTAAASILGLVSFVVAPAWWIALTAAGVALVALYTLLPRLLGRSR